jgi:hypothetical protein
MLFYMAEVPSGRFQDEELPRMYSKTLNREGTRALVSFKFFDVRQQQMQWLGSRLFDRSATLSSLLPMLHEWVGMDRLLVRDGSSQLRLWEEVKRDKVVEYEADKFSKTLAELNVISGDIFCLAEVVEPAALATVRAAWQADLHAQVVARRQETAADRAAVKAEPFDPKAPKKAYVTIRERHAAQLQDGVPPRPRFFDSPDLLLNAQRYLFQVRLLCFGCFCSIGHMAGFFGMRSFIWVPGVCSNSAGFFFFYTR